MSIGESVALIIVGAALRFLLSWKPRHISVQAIGIVYINFQEIGVVLMVGGAVSLAGWIALLVGRASG